MNYDKFIWKLFLSPKGRLKTKEINKLNNYPNIKQYIENRYDDSESIQESIRRIQSNIEEKPKCPICGKSVKFLAFYVKTNKFIFSTCCSKECGTLFAITNGKKTNISRYGVDNPSKTKKIKEKIKLSHKKTIEENTIINEKRKQTCLLKYGVDNVNKLPQIKEKLKNTCLMKYGCTNPLKNEKIKEKIQITCIKRYGVNSYFKTMDFLNYMKLNKDKINDKKISTKRKNHTFNTSKPEENLFLYIKSKFPDVKRQYKDKERYPYNCDFYIPELDYFIELQGYYTHNTHPYNPNSIKDQILLERYKEKYGPKCQAITIWTIKDVEKRNCAKEHKLNFKEVWSLDEGKKFIDNLHYAYSKSTITTD